MTRSGVSIIAAVLTLFCLSIFGAALVSIVATEQDLRTTEHDRVRAFYTAMTALEYGLGAVANGGYPNVTNFPLAAGAFSIQVIPASRLLTVTATSGIAQRSHQVLIPLLAGDCTGLDTTGSVPVGPDKDEINQVRIVKLCLTAVRLDTLLLSWTPDTGQKLIRVDYDGTMIFNDPAGVASGGTADFSIDPVIPDTGQHRFDRLAFTAMIAGVTMTMTVIFSDGSATTATWYVPAPGGGG